MNGGAAQQEGTSLPGLQLHGVLQKTGSKGFIWKVSQATQIATRLTTVLPTGEAQFIHEKVSTMGEKASIKHGKPSDEIDILRKNKSLKCGTGYGSGVRSTGCSCRGPKHLYSQHLRSESQPSVTPVHRDLMPSSGLLAPGKHMIHTCRKKSYI